MEKISAKYQIDEHILNSKLEYPAPDLEHYIHTEMINRVSDELTKKLEISRKVIHENNTVEFSTEFLLLKKSDVDCIMLNLKNIMYCSEQGWNDRIPSKLKNIQEILLYGKKEI